MMERGLAMERGCSDGEGRVLRGSMVEQVHVHVHVDDVCT